MSDLLQLVVAEGASDLHIRTNVPPVIRVHERVLLLPGRGSYTEKTLRSLRPKLDRLAAHARFDVHVTTVLCAAAALEAAANFTATGATLLSNYTLPTIAAGTGTINPAALIATIIGNPTKTYDGTTAATLASTRACPPSGSPGMSPRASSTFL